jgi:LPPG:FO 2-phospho-L-lactate transferase
VRRKCEPAVIDLSFVGASQARINPAVVEAVERADLIVLCPSNPYLSIDPILAVKGLARLIRQAPAPKVAVTPIIGGEAVKGPAAKLMRELGQMVSPITVVDHFDGMLDGFVLDQLDEAVHQAIDLPVLVTDTLMTDMASKTRLAQETVRFGVRVKEGA